MIRLLALDIDGTILDSHGRVPEANRDAIGARVTVRTGKHQQTEEVRSGGGYDSQSDLRLHFGLGPTAKADDIEIRWPSGLVQHLPNVTGNRIVKIREDTDLTGN